MSKIEIYECDLCNIEKEKYKVLDLKLSGIINNDGENFSEDGERIKHKSHICLNCYKELGQEEPFGQLAKIFYLYDS